MLIFKNFNRSNLFWLGICINICIYSVHPLLARPLETSSFSLLLTFTPPNNKRLLKQFQQPFSFNV